MADPTSTSSRILEQVVQFPHMFDYWVALAERLWKKKDSLIPSGGTPKEQSDSIAMLHDILDRLIVTAIPECDSVDNYDPNTIYVYDNYNVPQSQHRILKLLDLMALTNKVEHSDQLITLVSRPHKYLPEKYRILVIPLIPRLKARYKQYHATNLPILDTLLRALVGRYLRDLLGSPPRRPDASVNKVDCGCEDCRKANQFLQSDAVTETFRVAQRGRSHIENELRNLPQSGLTFTMVPRGRRHALQVTKGHETSEAGKWNTRVQKARTFLAIVGTPDELARIMGGRYPDVQAALAGTKPYEMGNPTLIVPPFEGAGAATSSAEATTSRAQTGPVVAGVKRKAEDYEDTTDLSSD